MYILRKETKIRKKEQRKIVYLIHRPNSNKIQCAYLIIGAYDNKRTGQNKQTPTDRSSTYTDDI